MSKKHDCVVILDFGAINAQMAAKAVRQMNIYCEVLPYSAKVERIEALKPKALIFQRGAACGERTLGTRFRRRRKARPSRAGFAGDGLRRPHVEGFSG